MWKSPLIAKFLIKLFNYLNKNNINYCVMSGYETLPEYIISDIDIAICEEIFLRLDNILIELIKDTDLEIIQKINHGYKKCAYIISPIYIDTPFRMQLDFFVDFSTKFFPNLLTSEFILENKIKKNLIFIPNPQCEFIFQLLRRIGKNDINNTKFAKIKELYFDIYPISKDLIRSFFPSKLALKIIRIIEQDNNFLPF